MFGAGDFNRAAVRDAVREEFERYEAALRSHDLAVLRDLFLEREDTVRFGIADLQYGSEAIARWRAASNPVDPGRALRRLTIVTYGEDCASVSAELVEPGREGVLRQSQVWVRTGQGWKIAAAHVSR